MAKTWNWKHLAARLLLVPVISGTAATAASAQSFQSSWKAPGSPAPAANVAPPMTPVGPATPAPAAVSPTADAKDLLKQSRLALSEGKLDAAQELCGKAEQAAAARQYRWGLFEDTPASLRKDITAARSKGDKAAAADAMKKAKVLFNQKGATDAARMQDLDQALSLAYHAKSLNPSTSMWDLSDKPDNLIGDIKAAQEALRKKTGIVPGSVAIKTTAPAAAPAIPAPSMPTAPVTAPVVMGTAKADVQKIVAEGRQLLSQNKVLDAKAKGDMARKMAEEKGVLSTFTATEDSPDALITACKTQGGEMVKSLMVDADKQIALAAWDRADAACNLALQMSNGLGLYARNVEEKKASIARNLKPATSSTTVATVPTVPVVPTIPAPATVKNLLLTQASNELARGDFEMARTMATRAYNDAKITAAEKQEAQTILRQVDAEIARRKQSEAATALNNALAVHAKGDAVNCQAILARIDAAMLTPVQKSQFDSAMADCTAKMNAGLKLAGATDDDLKNGLNKIGQDLKAATPPAAGTLVNEQKAVADVQFEKLKAEAIEVMKAAGAAWGKGDTDTCMKFLDEYIAKVNATSQPEPRKQMLLKPIQSRAQAYATLKHNYDYELKEARQKIDQQNQRVGERVAEAQKQEEIKKKHQEVEGLWKQGKYKDAEGVALQAKLLDPEDPSVKTLYELAKMKRRVEDNKKFKEDDEKFVFDQLNNAERMGPAVTLDNPLHVDPATAMRNAARGQEGILRARTATEQRLEGKLSASYPMLKFENMPLREVINQVRKQAGVNITVDEPTLEDEKIGLDSVIVNEEFKDLSLHSALKVILEKARLVHIIEDDVVKITTEKRTKGRLKTKVFHVMDLVTPIPEYHLAPHQTLTGAMAASQNPPAVAQMNAAMGGSRNPLNGGELISGGTGAPAGSGQGGSIQSNATPNGTNAMTPTRLQYAEQLKKLVTNLVRKDSWADSGQGGNGSVAYYDIGGAMVVNQTANVIEEVENLLNALRRLQDLSVAVEIRVVSLSETYFERIGVDFQANVTTNNASFERSITTGSFRPEPFINRIDTSGTTVGWSPATGFTSDLGVPIRPSSYNLTMPPFGGYQTSLSPTLNGGLSLGLAFLNDIQVYMFLEAAAGNRRINIMQAPKITLFNGQTSTVFVGDLAYFATALQVYSANGQFVYLPVNQSFPIGQGFNPNGTGTGTTGGVSVTVQAIISADRRFVRLNLTPSLTALASATVPLYPITTFITPVFEGGSQGQPIPFTQFFQQPSFTEISAQTTVAIPDGGTVLLGGLKTLAQGRNEFGPPVLSNIPYLNRLFKNVGIGQETRHVMLMVTPRIIINSEEEARQTGDGINGGLAPQP